MYHINNLEDYTYQNIGMLRIFKQLISQNMRLQFLFKNTINHKDFPKNNSRNKLQTKCIKIGGGVSYVDMYHDMLGIIHLPPDNFL